MKDKLNPLHEAFHRHLDQCDQCRNHPFELCREGAILLRAAAFVCQQETKPRQNPWVSLLRDLSPTD